MKLFTECFWDGWDKIVDIYTERYDTIPDYINDDENYKIIILEKGILNVQCGDVGGDIKAPAIILLNHKDKISCKIIKPVKTSIIFFKPSAIREEFTLDRIDSGDFEKTGGQIIYQDYLLIRHFTMCEDKNEQVVLLNMNALRQLKSLFTSMDKQLRGQKDGYWPCRSRSFLMEILHFIMYSFFAGTPEDNEAESDPDQEEFSKIAEYLEQHIGEHITLTKITLKFAINRNKLNEIFEKQTSMTCLNYLMHLRVDLAKILLTKTELPIGEIGARVGYPDSNYFTKVFKENVGKTPSQYREE